MDSVGDGLAPYLYIFDEEPEAKVIVYMWDSLSYDPWAQVDSVEHDPYIPPDSLRDSMWSVFSMVNTRPTRDRLQRELDSLVDSLAAQAAMSGGLRQYLKRYEYGDNWVRKSYDTECIEGTLWAQLALWEDRITKIENRLIIVIDSLAVLDKP